MDLKKNRFSPWRSEDNASYQHKSFNKPKVIELNTGPTCNLKCSFCPRADGWSEPGDYFEISLANKIAQELSEINFDGLIQFTGYGEPLQQPEICKLIEVFSKRNYLWPRSDKNRRRCFESFWYVFGIFNL